MSLCQVIRLDELPHLVLMLKGIAQDAPLHDLTAFPEESGKKNRGANGAEHQRAERREERVEVEAVLIDQPEDEQCAEAGEKDEENAHRFGGAPIQRHPDIQQLVLKHAVADDHPVENHRHAAERDKSGISCRDSRRFPEWAANRCLRKAPGRFGQRSAESAAAWRAAAACGGG